MALGVLPNLGDLISFQKLTFHDTEHAARAPQHFQAHLLSILARRSDFTHSAPVQGDRCIGFRHCYPLPLGVRKGTTVYIQADEGLPADTLSSAMRPGRVPAILLDSSWMRQRRRRVPPLTPTSQAILTSFFRSVPKRRPPAYPPRVPVSGRSLPPGQPGNGRRGEVSAESGL